MSCWLATRSSRSSGSEAASQYQVSTGPRQLRAGAANYREFGGRTLVVCKEPRRVAGLLGEVG